jgi:DNA-binding response OmpR family regulator
VAVVAASAAASIPALRQRLGGAAILLDLGHDSLEARSRCLDSGADDFWLSGLGPSDLLMRLRLHLGLQQGSRLSDPQLQVADLTINMAKRQVRRGGRSVALTAREYQLLLFLVERAGQVLSRESILASIWNDQQGAASNVIEVYVRYLRQKLEAGGERRLIHTVRGQGYCLCSGIPQLP